MPLTNLHRLIKLILVLTLGTAASAQSTLRVRFYLMYNNQPLQLDKKFRSSKGKDSLSITTFRFYISGVELYKGKNLAWKEKNSYHLIDAEDEQTLSVELPVEADLPYDHVHFDFGIDSVTNAAGAGSGVLDATKAMYWAWHSGYINMKLEGIDPACKTRKNAFQFHLGGFRGDDYCMQQISLKLKKKVKLDIVVDVAEFLKTINLADQNTVMLPGKDAVLLSAKAAKMFSVKSK